MRYREFNSLTDDEVRQIVTDLFSPEKITCITHHKRDEKISCKIYCKWYSKNEAGETEVMVSPSEVILRNPFIKHSYAIEADFTINSDDNRKLKQFCFAKGIVPTEWVEDNPYLEVEK